jgi:hypothetical protein
MDLNSVFAAGKIYINIIQMNEMDYLRVANNFSLPRPFGFRFKPLHLVKYIPKLIGIVNCCVKPGIRFPQLLL